MSLVHLLSEDMKASMKAKDSATLSTLRLLLSAIKNKKIDLMHELSDVEIQDVVKMQVKQLKDSLVLFEQGGRSEMVESAQREISVLKNYLPEQMSDDALKDLVKKTIVDVGATSKADMGKVMGATLKAAEGKVDGSRVKDVVMQLLPVVLLSFFTLLTFPSRVLAAIPLTSESLGGDTSALEFGLRLFRVLILWLGIPAISLILKGGFTYIIASNNDIIHKNAWGLIMRGVFGSLVVFLIFSFCTVLLREMQF